MAVLWAAAFAEQVWIFAVLFMAWALFDIAFGESNFIQRITRREHPVVFWAIISSWIAMSALWIIYA